MKTWLIAILLPLVVGSTWCAGQTCSDYNVADNPVLAEPSNTTGHRSGGYHQFYYTLTGNCTYASVGGTNCSNTSHSYGSISGQDTGYTTLTNPLLNHYLGQQVGDGTSIAPGGGATTTSQTTAGWAVEACNAVTGCSVVVTISAGASGVGATVSVPPSSIYANSSAIQTICPNEPDPQYNPCTTCGTCPPQFQRTAAGVNPDCSPIIVDTTGHGFQLTSANDGVVFDIRGDGHPIKLAWTVARSGNAFLALPHNGKVTNGKELFGNFTAQSPCTDDGNSCLNGYRALAEFDKPENGGNGDGIIDSRDAVFSKLRLWIDANHDGIAQPNELHTLPELGVYSINLKYRDDQHYYDQYGNWFHYQSALNPDPADGTSKDGRMTYDVFFVGATP